MILTYTSTCENRVIKLLVGTDSQSSLSSHRDSLTYLLIPAGISWYNTVNFVLMYLWETISFCERERWTEDGLQINSVEVGSKFFMLNGPHLSDILIPIVSGRLDRVANCMLNSSETDFYSSRTTKRETSASHVNDWSNLNHKSKPGLNSERIWNFYGKVKSNDRACRLSVNIEKISPNGDIQISVNLLDSSSSFLPRETDLSKRMAVRCLHWKPGFSIPNVWEDLRKNIQIGKPHQWEILDAELERIVDRRTSDAEKMKLQWLCNIEYF